jgi:excisionase family DNA binding protein
MDDLRGTKLGKDWRIFPEWLKDFCESHGGACLELHERLVTVEEASKALSLSVQAVRLAAIRGTLAGNKVGKQWRFSPRALEAYATGQTIETVPAPGGDPAPGDASAPEPAASVSRGVSPRAPASSTSRELKAAAGA